MIGKLKGIVDTVGEQTLLLDVNGVGYELYCSAKTLSALPAQGGAATILVTTHVREDHIHLYGFGSAAEKAWFERLQTVQGVGARMALGVLSVLSPDEVAQAISQLNKKAISQAPGVGPRLAERIVNELKDKVAKLGIAPAMGAAPTSSLVQDAVSALTHLGYREADIVPRVQAVIAKEGPDAPLDRIIREALKALMPQGIAR
jgi:Holliday junction DNA helicase RuvA